MVGVADWCYCGEKEQIFVSRAVLIHISMWLSMKKAAKVLGDLLAFTDIPTPNKGIPLGNYLKL